MPQGDRTGPNGEGAMTGRRQGFCVGNNRPGCFESGVGFRGGGRFRALNRGAGRGFRRGFGFNNLSNLENQQVQPQVITEKQEKQMLEQDLEDLKEEMQSIEKRLKEIQSLKDKKQ